MEPIDEIQNAKDHINSIRSLRIVHDTGTKGSNTDILERTLEMYGQNHKSSQDVWSAANKASVR